MENDALTRLEILSRRLQELADDLRAEAEENANSRTFESLTAAADLLDEDALEYVEREITEAEKRLALSELLDGYEDSED